MMWVRVVADRWSSEPEVSRRDRDWERRCALSLSVTVRRNASRLKALLVGNS